MSLLTAPEQSPAVVDMPQLRWSANHVGRYLPVQGGRREVRMLVGAIDGAAWPWTVIKLTDRRWFQVLGTAERCLLELGGSGGNAKTVARANSTERGWVGLPSECVWWVGAMRADEVLDADEATDIGMRWLYGHPLGYEWELRPLHPSGGRA